MVAKWNAQRPRYLSRTEARRGLRKCGDVNAMGRVHAALEAMGAINADALGQPSAFACTANFYLFIIIWLKAQHVFEIFFLNLVFMSPSPRQPPRPILFRLDPPPSLVTGSRTPRRRRQRDAAAAGDTDTDAEGRHSDARAATSRASTPRSIMRPRRASTSGAGDIDLDQDSASDGLPGGRRFSTESAAGHRGKRARMSLTSDAVADIDGEV
jgi:hypothetical protein